MHLSNLSILKSGIMDLSFDWDKCLQLLERPIPAKQVRKWILIILAMLW